MILTDSHEVVEIAVEAAAAKKQYGFAAVVSSDRRISSMIAILLVPGSKRAKGCRVLKSKPIRKKRLLLLTRV